MDGLVAGLYEIVPALQKVAAALTILALVVLGIGVITGGAEGRSKFKEVMNFLARKLPQHILFQTAQDKRSRHPPQCRQCFRILIFHDRQLIQIGRAHV